MKLSILESVEQLEDSLKDPSPPVNADLASRRSLGIAVEKTVAASSFKDRIPISTANNPVVLIEDNASFCTILASEDNVGNCATLHRPLEICESCGAEYVNAYVEALRENQFLKTRTLITATSELLSDGGKEAHVRVERIVNNAMPDSEVITRFSTLQLPIHGLILIPRQLTRSSLNEVFLLTMLNPEYRRIGKVLNVA